MHQLGGRDGDFNRTSTGEPGVGGWLSEPRKVLIPCRGVVGSTSNLPSATDVDQVVADLLF